MKLYSSLDLNPALKLKWKPLIANNDDGSIAYDKQAFSGSMVWLRFEDSKDLLYLFPFAAVTHTKMRLDKKSGGMAHDELAIFVAVAHKGVMWDIGIYDVDRFMLDENFDLYSLEFALVPWPNDIDWQSLKVWDSPNEDGLFYENAPILVSDEIAFFTELDNNEPKNIPLVFLWPAATQKHKIWALKSPWDCHFTSQPYFFRDEYTGWRSLYSHQNDYDVNEFEDGDKWIYMFNPDLFESKIR